ncbi:MAG: HAMP domain-containing histidine kinase, partial [Pseudomonadota bacterium]|nr:HAMP domain-containing histidine kinase [Pseudomonadota bacterium]
MGAALTTTSTWVRFAGSAISAFAGAAAVFGVSVSPAPSRLSSSMSLFAMFGTAFAARLSAAQRSEDGRALRALAGDFVARHGVDGRVSSIEGDGWRDLDRAALIGDGLLARLHEDDRARFLDQISAVNVDGGARAATLRLRTSGEGFAHVDVSTARAADRAGLVSALRPSCSAPALEAELQCAREEARLEKSLKDRLLANMSHELRTPLNAILGFSEILGDPALVPAEADKRFEYARIIHSSADHLLSVVNLVLDMSRIEAGKFAILPEPLEMAPLIAECRDMLRLRAERGQVRIVVAPIVDGLEIVADKGACRQIVVNLLSNAVKFTPPNGRVIVEARVEGDEALLSVTDTGIGVKPEDLPRLGDPFFQIKNGYDRRFECTGLGL